MENREWLDMDLLVTHVLYLFCCRKRVTYFLTKNMGTYTKTKHGEHVWQREPSPESLS